MPLGRYVLCVSGRVSFQLVQKAAIAGAPVLVGVGTPTLLAVALARDADMALCGFAAACQADVRPQAAAPS